MFALLIISTSQGPVAKYLTSSSPSSESSSAFSSSAYQVRFIILEMLALRSGTMFLALFKAPSAAATVGYLSLGLTLPFAAAYKEKSQPCDRA